MLYNILCGIYVNFDRKTNPFVSHKKNEIRFREPKAEKSRCDYAPRIRSDTKLDQTEPFRNGVFACNTETYTKNQMASSTPANPCFSTLYPEGGGPSIYR